MTKQFKKLSHTIYECKYYIVCCPKYRHRIWNNFAVSFYVLKIYIP